jgi:hypothetical protein
MELATPVRDTGLTFWERQFKMLDFLVQLIGVQDFTVITNSQQLNETRIGCFLVLHFPFLIGPSKTSIRTKFNFPYTFEVILTVYRR